MSRTGRTALARLSVGAAGAVLGVGLLAAVGMPRAADGVVAPATYAGPVAELHIDAQAYEGQRGTILAGLRGRCAPGYEFAGLVLEFTQGEVVTPPQSGAPFVCDGQWHRQAVTSYEAFEAGPATLVARLTVVDRATGDPGPQATETKRIYVRPAAQVQLPATVRLRPHAVVKVTVRARCDAPWVLQSFSLRATQGEFPSIASDAEYLDLPCDGVLRPFTVWFTSTPIAFRRGWLRLDSEITLLDPEQFDPVTQAVSTRVVRVG